MIGLMFLGVLILWLAFSLALGIKAPKWLGLTRHRLLVSVLFVPIIFFAPVADEIFAYPEMDALCEAAKDYRYDAAAASGRTVSKFAYVLGRTTRELLPSVRVTVSEYGLRAVNNGEAVVRWTVVESTGGWLHFPAGASGASMSLILPRQCSTIPRGRASIEDLKLELRLRSSDIELPN